LQNYVGLSKEIDEFCGAGANIAQFLHKGKIGRQSL
jgi:hypothetical protein